MAIVSVKESPLGRQIGRDKDGKIKATRIFYVTTDAPTDFAAVIGAGGIPANGDLLPGFTDIFAQDIRATDRGSAKAWRVTVEYGPEDEEETGDGGEGDPNDPTNNPVQIRGGSEFLTRALRRDLDGKPVQNSVDQPFDQPLEIEVALPYLLLEQNEGTAPYAKARQFTNKINSSNFWGAGARTLLCHDITFNNDFWTHSETGEVKEFWVVQYKLLYDEEKWHPFKVHDVGYREKKPDGKWNELDPDTKLRPTRPKPLKEGKWVDVPDELEFRVKGEADFGGLGLRS